MKLVFSPPDTNTPGFLKRARVALEFRQGMSAKDAGPELIDKLIDFLLPYVKEPKDRKEAYSALLDATEMQFNQLLDEVMGTTGENPTIAQKMNEQSNSGQAE